MRPGRGSASWRINGERVVVLGWPSAILMQFAHPLIAQGVADHSSFQQGRLAPLSRLHGTIRAMLDMTFGDELAARAAANRINRIHDRVNGTLPHAVGAFPAGTPYSAHNPHLLAWVQLTLLDTMPRAYELLVGPLRESEKDAYCLEARPGARMLGIPDSFVPATYHDVSEAVAAALGDGSLVVADTARALARDILRPAIPAPWPAHSIHRLVTIGLLSPALRRAYDVSWSVRDDEQLEKWSARLRRLSSHAPAFVRRWRAAGA
jgi:uncharacterized protein (DUF2236 family)